jgi:hypothetical protein
MEAVFWDVTSWSLVYGYLCFGGIYCLHLHGASTHRDKHNRGSNIVGAFSPSQGALQTCNKMMISVGKSLQANSEVLQAWRHFSSPSILDWVPWSLTQICLNYIAAAIKFSTQPTQSTSWEADSWSASHEILHPSLFWNSKFYYRVTIMNYTKTIHTLLIPLANTLNTLFYNHRTFFTIIVKSPTDCTIYCKKNTIWFLKIFW